MSKLKGQIKLKAQMSKTGTSNENHPHLNPLPSRERKTREQVKRREIASSLALVMMPP
jgi:hypothetical protein